MEIPLVQLMFTLEIPATGSTQDLFALLRKLFPRAFRRATGCSDSSGECGAGPDCPCRATFGQALTPDPLALRRYQKPPLPFAFQLAPHSPGKGKLELFLNIAGDAANHLALYVAALRMLFASDGSGNPWGARLMAVAAGTGDGQRVPIPAAGPLPALPLLSFDEFLSISGAGASSVTLEFVTPLRIVHDGTLLLEPPFSSIAGALFRRISSLAYYYGGRELPHDFKWLAAKSREVSCSGASMTRSYKSGILQGGAGSISYMGDLADFMPFLSLGEYLNLGKGSAYGMGCYLLHRVD